MKAQVYKDVLFGIGSRTSAATKLANGERGGLFVRKNHFSIQVGVNKTAPAKAGRRNSLRTRNRKKKVPLVGWRVFSPRPKKKRLRGYAGIFFFGGNQEQRALFRTYWTTKRGRGADGGTSGKEFAKRCLQPHHEKKAVGRLKEWVADSRSKEPTFRWGGGDGGVRGCQSHSIFSWDPEVLAERKNPKRDGRKNGGETTRTPKSGRKEERKRGERMTSGSPKTPPVT